MVWAFLYDKDFNLNFVWNNKQCRFPSHASFGELYISRMLSVSRVFSKGWHRSYIISSNALYSL